MTPRSGAIDLVSIATAGVGIGPKKQHVHSDRGKTAPGVIR